MDLQKIGALFGKHFGEKAGTGITASRGPGRLNLIGEHTDYNGGFVLPMAIDFSVFLAGRARGDRKIKLFSADYGEAAEADLDGKFDTVNPRWSLYIEGVARTFEEQLGEKLPGFEAVVAGDVPQGAGLSSSAALEVAAGFFLNGVHGLRAPKRDVALYGQMAENNYLGMRCGIMDQFASGLCERGTALFLDCRSLEFEQVPVELERHVFMILNTNKSRELVGSEYNDRRRACEEGVRLISREEPGVKALRDVTPEMFSRFEKKLPGDIARKCRHIVTENARVLAAVKHLKAGNLAEFGRRMWESHDSLRDDYEVSCRELDAMNEIARGIGGVLGERMTGAGFGGCAVALVEKAAAAEFEKEIRKRYPGMTGLAPEIYATGAAAGAEVTEL